MTLQANISPRSLFCLIPHSIFISHQIMAPKVCESGAKMCTSITSLTSDGSRFVCEIFPFYKVEILSLFFLLRRSDTSVSLLSDTFLISSLDIGVGRGNYDSLESRNRLDVLERAAFYQPYALPSPESTNENLTFHPK